MFRSFAFFTMILAAVLCQANAEEAAVAPSLARRCIGGGCGMPGGGGFSQYTQSTSTVIQQLGGSFGSVGAMIPQLPNPFGGFGNVFWQFQQFQRMISGGGSFSFDVISQQLSMCVQSITSIFGTIGGCGMCGMSNSMIQIFQSVMTQMWTSLWGIVNQCQTVVPQQFSTLITGAFGGFGSCFSTFSNVCQTFSLSCGSGMIPAQFIEMFQSMKMTSVITPLSGLGLS